MLNLSPVILYTFDLPCSLYNAIIKIVIIKKIPYTSETIKQNNNHPIHVTLNCILTEQCTAASFNEGLLMIV